MNQTEYALAFSAGFLGSFGHCISMCGPFVVSCIMYDQPGSISIKSAVPQLMYNAGRITTYTMLSAMAGLAGSFLDLAGKLAGLQSIAAVLAGGIMVLMGAGISGLPGRRMTWEGGSGFMTTGIRTIAGSGGIWRYYPMGLLLGFMPCGLSYSIFFGAAGSGGMLQGGLIGLLFGLGTAPALILFGMLATALSLRLRGLLYRAGGIAIILMGLIFIARGLRSYAAM